MGKCLEHCIGKNKGTGLEDGLIECKLIWLKKTIEQVLNGTHHVKSLRGIFILRETEMGRIFESLWKRKIFKYIVK